VGGMAQVQGPEFKCYNTGDGGLGVNTLSSKAGYIYLLEIIWGLMI
jgi:hypothetical protein